MMMIIFILLFGYDSLTFSEDFSLEFFYFILLFFFCVYVKQEEFKVQEAKHQSNNQTRHKKRVEKLNLRQ